MIHLQSGPPVQRVVCSWGITPCCQTAPKDASLTVILFRLSVICHFHLPVKRAYFFLFLLSLNGSSYSFTLNLSIAWSCASCS